MTAVRRRYRMRRIEMTCDRCGFQQIRHQRGACPMCRDGLMLHEKRRMRVYIDAKDANNAPATE